jgi:hypothetical protein
MSDRSYERRQFAAECLALAQCASDLNVRASLIDMAQKWLQLADEQYSGQALRDAVSQFNEQQLLTIEPFDSTKRSLD